MPGSSWHQVSEVASAGTSSARAVAPLCEVFGVRVPCDGVVFLEADGAGASSCAEVGESTASENRVVDKGRVGASEYRLEASDANEYDLSTLDGMRRGPPIP